MPSRTVPDNCSLALAFRYLDWPSLLACRRVSRAWHEQSRHQLIGDGRGWVHKRDRQATAAAMDNSHVRALCASLPFLRLLDLSKQDKLSRADPITERALASIAALSSLTSLTLTHYSTAVSDRSCLHLCKLRRLRTLSLSASRLITSQALLYLSASPVARSLTSLDLSSCCGLTDVSALRDMRSLGSVDLSECRRLTVASLSSALSSHSLIRLSLRGTHTTTKALSFLLQSPASLHTLDLRATDVDDGIALLLAHLRPSLKVLRLAECSALTAAFLPSLSALLQSDELPVATLPFASLRFLDLNHLLDVVGDSTLPLLPPLAPFLQVLSVASTPITTTQPLNALTRLHSLHADFCHSLLSLPSLHSLPLLRLSLWDCAELSEHQLLPLMHSATLRHVNLCGCRGVEGRMWQCWNKHAGMPNLERLNVRFCGGGAGVERQVARLRADRTWMTLLF